MQNKIAALLVLAMFVVSIAPFVAAEEGSQGDAAPELTSAEPAEAQETGFEKSRIQQREQIKAKMEELRQKREEVRVQLTEKRESLKAKYEKARERREERKELYQEFKEKRQEIKSEREAARAEIGKVRDKVRDCVADSGDECVQARNKAKVEAGKFLTRSAEHIIALLEKAKERVQNSALGDAEKQARIAAIDAMIADVDAALQSVSTVGEDTTKEDMKDAAQLIRDVWGRSKKEIKKGVGLVASDRIGGILVKMERLATKFDNTIAKLEAKGKDVSGIKAKEAEYRAKLDAAKALQQEAKSLFESGDHDAAAEKIRAAHAELKSAHELLKGLVQEIRGIGAAKELEESAEPVETEPVVPAETAEGNETSAEDAE